MSFNSRAHVGRDRRETRHGAPRVFCFNSRAHVGRDALAAAGRIERLRVSIHAPTWGATLAVPVAESAKQVSIHAPTWGATPPHPTPKTRSNVSIHAPTWGATRPSISRTAATKVSIHAPTWGATIFDALAARDVGFNSRAHVGRDRGRGGSLARRHVSIHAPTWGATFMSVFLGLVVSFNSRAHVGRDIPATIFHSSGVFQFTRPRGARQEVGVIEVYRAEVSIHAPTWGATFLQGERAGVRRFQFTRPRGARPSPMPPKRREVNQFQFTRPRGARRSVPPCRYLLECFNSRAHVGRDGGGWRLPRGGAVSIHAPTWGATRRVSRARPERGVVSIHAPTWGATGRSRRPRRERRCFNSRAHVGRDTEPFLAIRRAADVSIHAPTWGATSMSAAGYPIYERFNSRAHVGRDAALSAPARAAPTCFNSRAHVGRDRRVMFAVPNLS